MSSLTGRANVPQAFVSSYAPRLRTYANSVLTAVQPAIVLPNVRTTKRGTTAINYAEDFEDDTLEDSDAPRRPTGLRSLRQREEQAADKTGPQKDHGKEAYAPVDLQAIWRDWMGKPKRNMTEKQVQVQSALPVNLVPIRIDLNIAPYQPEPALPKPHQSRDMGVDDNSPAYKLPEMTPEYRLKDYFLWNLHEALMTPDQFAKVFVDELDLPNERKTVLVMQITQQIRTQLEDHASVELHPFFNTNKNQVADTRPPSTKPGLSRDHSSTPINAGTPSGFPIPQTNGVSTTNASTPRPTEAVTATAQPLTETSLLNPEDAHRCIISLSLNLQNQLYTDKFEWSLLHPPGVPEIFAKQTCADLGLSGEWVPALSHSIYEAVLKLKKDVCENGGTLYGVVGSGIDAWGQVDNESAEVHGDGSLAIGEAAGWRYDHERLGDEWEPRVETLSKDEIEKREGDRERQIRRLRRETANRVSIVPQPSGYGFGFGADLGGEEERMGRGERSKKKRRFRSLSPAGRDSPDVGGFGEASRLTESERQVWRCSHCRIWGGAVWGVRDGPHGARSLCNNCGLLYEENKRLPPWSRDLYANERPYGSARPDPPAQTHSQHQIRPMAAHPQSFSQAMPHYNTFSSQHTPQQYPTQHSGQQGTPQSMSRFVPNPARAYSQTFFRNSPSSDATNEPSRPAAPPKLPEQYAATLRGGGPGMFEDYAVEGEDLDWTKVTDPRERKRLQNIINGRKYRERRLAMEAEMNAAGGGGRQGGSPALGSGGRGGYSFTATPPAGPM